MKASRTAVPGSAPGQRGGLRAANSTAWTLSGWQRRPEEGGRALVDAAGRFGATWGEHGRRLSPSSLYTKGSHVA